MEQQQVTAATASTPAQVLMHTDTTAKWFLISAVSYFFIVGIIAVTIAAKFVWPELLGTVSIFTYGRLRPLHVNGMLFGWAVGRRHGAQLLPDPAPVRREAVERKAGRGHGRALWNIIVLGAVVELLAGHNQGWEYAELPMWEDILVVIAWVMFGANIFMTVANRRYQQMYVSIWYTLGTILWTAFVYLTGNFATLFTTGRQPGQPELDVRAQRRRPDLYSGGAGACLLLHPESVQRAACTATSCR